MHTPCISLIKWRTWKIKSFLIISSLKIHLYNVAVWQLCSSAFDLGPVVSLTDYKQWCKVTNTMQQGASRSLLVEMELDLKSPLWQPCTSKGHRPVCKSLSDSCFQFTVLLSVILTSASCSYLAAVSQWRNLFKSPRGKRQPRWVGSLW